MAGFSKVTHVIYDLDGLLLDSEKIYKKSFETLASRYGKTFTVELRHMIMGTVEQDTARILKRELELPLSDTETNEELQKIHRQGLGASELMPGAERLLRHLHKNNIPFAVATGSSSDSVAVKLQNHQELFSLVHHFVCGSSEKEVKNGKPAPDIFLICASRFPDKPQPDKCLVFEDAPNGVLAARSAGMQVVMVPDADVAEDKKKPATLVLQSLLDFKPELFGLPPFSD